MVSANTVALAMTKSRRLMNRSNGVPVINGAENASNLPYSAVLQAKVVLAYLLTHLCFND